MRLAVFAVLSIPLLAQQLVKFSYSTTLVLTVTADGFERELNSDLAREFESLDGVHLVTGPANRTVQVVAVRTQGPVVLAAAVAVLFPLQGWLDAKVLRQSDEPRFAKLGESMILDDLIVFTGGLGDVRDLARRIVAWINSEYLMHDRDLKYRLFRAQHPDQP